MAKLTSISNSVFDSILPSFGNPAIKIPVWNEGQKMFIADEYETAAGNRYYKGIRFCENLAVVETVGNYHCWTYIDSIEIYAFDGKERKLIGKRQYNKRFYDADFIKLETKEMVMEYMKGQLKLQEISTDENKIIEYATYIVDRSYTSLLSDDYLPRLMQMLPVINPSRQLSL